MNTIELRIKANTKEAEASISRLAKSIASLTGTQVKTKQVSGIGGGGFFGVDTRQMQDYVRVSKQLTQSAINDAKQASRTKQQIDVIDARNAAKMAEIAARGRIQTETTTSRALEAQRQRDFADYSRVEREKAKIAEIAARSRVQAENNAARALEAQRRREFAEYTRTEKEKSKLAQAENRRRESIFSSTFKGSVIGSALGNVAPSAANWIRQAALDGIQLNATLDKLVRFTATLDKNFQTPLAMKTFTEDIKKLSTEIPQSAESIAKASFTVKSAYADLTEPEVIEFLRQFGIAATGSNADIAEHTEKVAALAKQYGITAKELPQFNAMIASSFGAALSSDSQVAEGFNKLIVAAKLAKIPLNDLIAAMSTMQSTSSDAAGNTTNLVNAIQKLGDSKYIEGLKEVFNIDRFKNGGKELKTLNEIVNELAKKLEGLSDADKLKKLNEVFKDMQANQGINSLINGVKQYNEQLRNGADMEAFQRKNDLMLSATENRWKQFYANIENIQSDTGGKFSDTFLSAFDSTTVAGGIAIFFNNIGVNVAQGLLELGGIINKGGTYILDAFDYIFGTNLAEPARAHLDEFFNGLRNWFGEVGQKNREGIIVGQTQYWAKVLADPLASPQVRAEAQKNLEKTQQILNQMASEGALKSYEAWKKQGDAIVEALKSTNPQIQQAARDQASTLQKELSKAAQSADFTPDLKAKMLELGETLSKATAGGIVQNKAAVDNAMQNLITPPTAQTVQAANNLGSTFTSNVATSIQKTQPQVTSAVNGLINTNAAATQAQTQGFKVGSNLGGGLLQGMRDKLGEIRSLSMLMGKTAEQGLSTQLQIKSPSKITEAIGEFFGEGFIRGIENKIDRAKSSAKKLADETVKAFKDAVKEFNKLAGASPDVVQGIQATNRVTDAVSAQQEIIRMRRELGLNQYKPLPSDVSGTESELAYLKQKQQEAEDFQKSLDDITAGYKDLQEAIEASKKAFDERLQSMRDSGAMELLDLKEQIDLSGVVNERDRERIQNYYDIQRLRQEMKNDGFGEAQIDEAQKILETEQARRANLTETLRVKKQIEQASDLGSVLSDQLAELQNGGRELSEYEKTLAKINKDLKDIPPEQREQLLNLAKQIDAQKAFNRQYEQTYNLVRDSFDILTQSGVSFGDKMKQIFGGIADRFRQMLLDMAAQWLTSKIFKTGQSGGGFNLGSLSQIFNGGGSGSGTYTTPPIFGNNYQGGGFGGSYTTQFNGGSSYFDANGRYVVNPGPANAGAGSGIGLSGGLAIAGMGANLLGGLVGGRFGNVLSGAGTGLAIGAQIGSIIPGIGTAIGAAAGAVIGGIAGLFQGDPKRKIDKKENMPKLQQGFIDSIKGFQDLIADVSALRTDPDGAMARGREIRAAIASGFSIDWQSKKYKKIAQQQIAQQLASIDRQPDGLMEQLKRAVDMAKAAGERQRRILPEFADGGAVSRFFAQNFAGLVPGIYDRLDNKLIRVSGNEVVLTPRQWQPIAPYLAAAKVPGFADGGFVPSAVSQTTATALPPVIHIHLEGEIDKARIKDVSMEGLQSEAGKNVVVSVLKKADLNRELEDIKKKRR